MRRITWTATAVGLFAAVGAASAHRAPAQRENNRYVKLTVTGNRVRLLYTFYVGEVPGAQLRPRLDRDGDGTIDTAEADAYGHEVRDTVERSLALEVDSTPYPVAFSSVDVGMGTPSVNAGAFAVDLVAWVCLPDPATRTSHTLRLRDSWHPPLPGETELRVEESPGVRASATLGDGVAPSQLRFKWTGTSDVIATEGLRVDVAVDPARADTSPVACADRPAPAATQPARRRGLLIAGAAALAVVFVGAWVRYRKMKG